MSTAIRVENLSKAYQIGEFSTGTLSRDLARWWAKTRGKEDPFLKIGEENDRSRKGDSDVAWSLKDLNFDIEQGDAVGIIGKNGAGKSTLLKILSRVTTPTTGSVKVKGRIASLLEVGTGFHPELTGRENIFLNGAILGMRKKEIRKRFDEIVDFAGIERYIDTPVKRYSSGMYVRLAFAVAAHLESEILIVDEVLAVGDAEFQKKCLGKMGDVSKGEGRTVLFVSHNMEMIKRLCSVGIFLQNGTLLHSGPVASIVNNYLSYEVTNTKESVSLAGAIRKISVRPKSGDKYYPGCGLISELIFVVDNAVRNPVVGIMMKRIDGHPLFALNNTHYQNDSLTEDPIFKGTIHIEIPELPLMPGKYFIDFFFGVQNTDIDICREKILIEVRSNPIIINYPDEAINSVFIKEAVWRYLPS